MRMIGVALSGVYLTLCACAGDGEGLDENGRPIEEAAEPLEATLASIQRNVFTPMCTSCHAGAQAPLGLRLEEGAAFAMLVNAPSVQVPMLARVAPGDPDASYLIQKLEGVAAVGARMPLNAPALPAETIAVIRQWIIDGAQPTTPASSGAKPTTLTALWPLEGAALKEPPSQILLSASAELDTSLLGTATVALRGSGGDGDFSNGNERMITAGLTLRSLEPTVLAFQLPDDAWTVDDYELRMSGEPPLPVADRAAQPIDGDADGAPGGDFVLRFSLGEHR